MKRLYADRTTTSHFHKNFVPYVIFSLSVSHCGFRYLCFFFFTKKPICSSPRYYSVSARIRTWRRPLISSIKQRKRRNIVGLQFRFAVPLSWHEVRPLDGRRLRKHGASFISPTNLLSRTGVARTGHKNSAALSIEYK